jgi:hypothetical protein
MCRELSGDPPVLVDESGGFYGRLAKAEFQSKGVCGVFGDEKSCRTVRAVCKEKLGYSSATSESR